MTTEQGIGDQTVSQEAKPVSPEVSAPKAPVESPPSERMVPQSEVDKLVVGVKKETEEKLLAKLRTQQAQTTTQPLSSSQQGQQPAPSSDEIESKLDAWWQKREAAKHQQDLEHRQQQELQQLVTDLKPKIDQAAQKYDDFNQTVSPDVMQEVLSANPYMLALANQVDNSGDVLYEIMKQPEKLAMVNQLSATPSQAVSYVKKLSQSIKDRDAAKTAQPVQPFNKVKPSTVGAGEGPMTVADYKARYKGKL